MGKCKQNALVFAFLRLYYMHYICILLSISFRVGVVVVARGVLYTLVNIYNIL